jgi:glycine dehydrogenase subunit 1
VVREFALRLDVPVTEVLDRCAAEGIGGGYPLGRDYPELEDGLLVALTERRSRADIDRFAEVLGRAVADLRGAKVAEGATT